MNRVDDVERVNTGGVDVRLHRVRVHRRVLDIDEVERRGRLRGRHPLRADVGDGVVATIQNEERYPSEQVQHRNEA